MPSVEASQAWRTGLGPRVSMRVKIWSPRSRSGPSDDDESGDVVQAVAAGPGWYDAIGQVLRIEIGRGQAWTPSMVVTALINRPAGPMGHGLDQGSEVDPLGLSQ
jgi:hypothetical protein